MAGGHLESMTGIGGLGSSTRDTDTFGYSLRNHQRAELPRRMKAMIQHKRRPQPYLLPLNKGLTGPFMKLKASLPPGEDSSSIGLLQGRMTQEALSLRCAQEVNSVVGALSLIQTRRQVTSEAQSSMPGMNEDVKQAATVHASENTRKRLLTRHLTQCWNKFSPHLPAREMYSLIISTGERIMSMPRMHDVAYIACFKYFLDRADSYEATLPPPATRPSTAVIDTVNPVDLKKQIGATPRTFRPRAQLGKHMADYHALRYSDPALSSRQSIVKVLDILSAILEVMKNGVLMEEPEAGAWAVWDGAGKVRTIAGSMIAAGYSEEVRILFLGSLLCN
ncbi:hypothetical protein DFS34DRAFT_147660 [Phlyctochytrium arcticum]|nr:hypothetical protein DFS34DRAFT_147660 [Phlyctochytrium arcticum]